jgi:molybdenum cofactor synthesis domain-containing protein
MNMPNAKPTITAAVITVSDSCHSGKRKDISGPAIGETLKQRGFEVIGFEVVPDESADIQRAIIAGCEKARLVVTTGGTGAAPRDVTPEATVAVCSRVLPGVAERMRAEGTKKTPLAALSRAVCGIRGTSLVLNLPGSPAGATDSFLAVVNLMTHALGLLTGEVAHEAKSGN